jgi:hypothetical protein
VVRTAGPGFGTVAVAMAAAMVGREEEGEEKKPEEGGDGR